MNRSRQPIQFHLVVAFILMFPASDIRPDYLFIKPDRRNKIPRAYKNLVSEIIHSFSEAPWYCDCALSLNVTHHVRHLIFQWNADTHVTWSDLARPSAVFASLCATSSWNISPDACAAPWISAFYVLLMILHDTFNPILHQSNSDTLSLWISFS